MQQQQQQLSKLALRPAPGPLRIPHKHHSGKANFAQDAPHLLQKRQQYICKYVEEPSEPAGASPPSGSSLPPQGLSGNTDEAFIFLSTIANVLEEESHLRQPLVKGADIAKCVGCLFMNLNMNSTHEY